MLGEGGMFGMIKRLRVQNFMSLKDTTIELSPLTVFIGPNASGKSATFKALVALSKLLRQFPVQGTQGEFSLESAVTLDRMVWQGNSGLRITFEIWFSDDPDDKPGYTLELAKEARGWMVHRERLRLDDRWFDSQEDVLEFPTERRGTLRFEAPNRATLCHLVYPYRNDRQAFPVISPFLEFSERFGQVWRYRPSASDIASFWAHNQTEGGRERLPFVRENGGGLALVLQGLQGQDRKDRTETYSRGSKETFTHYFRTSGSSVFRAIGLECGWPSQLHGARSWYLPLKNPMVFC